MENTAHPETGRASGGIFGPGSVILATLGQPREKFWGRILSIDPAGVVIRGLDLNSMDTSFN